MSEEERFNNLVESVFEKPLPRKPDGSIDMMECIFAIGPIKGRRLRDLTMDDVDLSIYWANHRPNPVSRQRPK